MTETIQQTLQSAASRLKAAGIDTAWLDAEVLLRHVLGIDRTHLFMRYPDQLPDAERSAFDALIAQRLNGAPVAYLTGIREFMGLSFHVAPGVLIPRPDTEPLIEWALQWLATHPSARIVDIGTGSGAIAIAVAVHLPASFNGEIMGIDTSRDALDIARQNAARLAVPDRQPWLTFAEGSLTEPLVHPVDLLLANLPYLTPGQIAGNPDLNAEPLLALDGGPDGLDFIRSVINDLPRILSPGGAAGFEIDPSQAAVVSSLLRTKFPDGTIDIIDDLARLSRHVVLTRS